MFMSMKQDQKTNILKIGSIKINESYNGKLARVPQSERRR
jgi:hypothetical protein